MSLDQQLLAAVEGGYTQRCLELIESKANINALDLNGRTPLMCSISYSHIDTALALIDSKADVTMKDRHGYTCLNWAAWEGQLALCRAMVEQYGADVNAAGKCGSTPLIEAASWGNADVCVYLLNAGARVDAETKEGKTALQWAVQCNNTDAAAAIRAWLKDRNAAAAFQQGTKHAYDTYQTDSWTMNALFDWNLIGEITSYVTPNTK